MKYLVVMMRLESEDVDWSSAPYVEAVCPEVVGCDSTRAVAEAIRETKTDWSVFELTEGRYVRRAVIFKMDGRVAYDVEVV